MLRRWTRHWNPHRANLRLTFRSAVILTLVVTACGSSSTPRTGIVDRVIDGDTLVVRARIWLGQEVETAVRLDGIDTPELKSPCAAERELADRARDTITGVADGRRVVLRDVRYGKFAGRVLARISGLSRLHHRCF